MASERPRALVTGCSSGFGALLVPALVRRGFQVVATARDPARVAGGEHVTVTRLDVLDPRTITAAVAAAGPVDVLVNNAGVARPNFLEEAPEQEWQETFATNLFGQAAVSNAVLPSMRERGRGRIIMMGSVGGRVPDLGLGVYSASKAALACYAQTLRMELRRTGVRVHLIEPGAFATNIYASPVLRTEPDPASGYASDSRRLRAFYRTHVDHGLANPARVVEVVAQVAAGRDGRFRHLVGADARAKAVLGAVLPMRAYERLARVLVGLDG